MTPQNFDNLIQLVAANAFWIAAAFTPIGVVGFCCVKDMVVNKSRERTRREIAAYVAEGSMTPEPAARLMAAGQDAEDYC